MFVRAGARTTMLCGIMVVTLVALGLWGAGPAVAASTGAISGTVTSDRPGGLDPRSNLTVELNFLDLGGGSTRVANQKVDLTTGKYSVGDLADGSYILKFVDSEDFYVEEYWDDNLYNATTIQVSGGTARNNIDATLQATGIISGTVRSDDTGDLDRRASVYVSVINDAGNMSNTSPVNNVDGSYAIAGFLVAGSYRLKFWDWADGGCGYATEYYDDALTPAEATLVSAESAKETKGIDASLAWCGSITGTVRPEGATAQLDPNANIQVQMFNSNGRFINSASVDNASGTYSFPGIDTGPYRLAFYDYAHIYAQEYFDNRSSLDTATELLVRGQLTHVDAQLAAGGSITGVVSQVGGGAFDPESNMVVEAYSSAGLVTGSTWVDDATGRYTVAGLPAGDYRLSFSDDEGTPYISGDIYIDEYYNHKGSLASADPIRVESGKVTGGKDTTLTRKGSITGTLSPDAIGGFALGTSINVYIYRTDGTTLGSTSVDPATGRYRFPSLMPGDYRLQFRVDHGPYASEFYNNKTSLTAADPVTVKAGVATAGIDARLAGSASISGTVRPDATGALHPYAQIVAFAEDAAGTSVASGDVRADGTYTISNVAPGSYRLHFTDFHGHYEPEYYNDKFVPFEANVLTVSVGTALTGIDAGLRSVGIPSPPRSVSAVAGDSSATVSWSDPVHDGVPATQSFTATSNPDSRTCTTTGAKSCTVSGLTNGKGYAFTVTAMNSIGTSNSSAPSNLVVPQAGGEPPPQDPVKGTQWAAGPRGKIKRGKRVGLAAITNAGIRIRWSSVTPKICKVKAGKLTAGKKKGTCRVSARASGNTAWYAFAATYSVKIK